MKKTKKLVFMALLTAISLVIWVIEAQIPPPVPVPGIKLGLASVVTLTAMTVLGRKEALGVLIARVLLSAVFAGSMSALLFSLTGGLLSWVVMALTVKLFDRKLLWVVSVFGAIGHNAGQLLAAMAVTKTAALIAYGPILLCAAIITGAFTGAAAMYLTAALERFRR
ncbi:MAG: Gx transporter family protein [Oscillospiraceae bacterium]